MGTGTPPGNGRPDTEADGAPKQTIPAETLDRLDDKLLDLLPGAVYFCDHEGVLVRWNRAAVELWGREPKVGEPSERFCGSYKLYRTDGTLMPHADCPVAEALRIGHPQRNIEAIIERPDGSRRFILANIDAVRDESGAIIGAVNIFQDISDRKQAEAALRQSEQRYRRLLDNLPAAGYTCDAQGNITYFNRRAVELWGREPLLNDPVDRYCGSFKLFSTGGEPIDHDQCWMALALREERDYNRQMIIVERPDGSRRTALAHASPYHDDSGKVSGAVNILVDITDHQRAEAALKQSEAQMRLVAEHAPIFLIHCDREGRYKYVNKRYAERLGLTPQEIVGKHISEVIGEQAFSSFREYVEAALTGRYVEFEVEIPYEKIGPHVMHCACAPDFGPNGQVRGLVAVLSDVTARKRAENALRESQEHLRAVVETTPACIKTVAADGTLLDMNSAGLAMVDAERPEEVKGQCVYDLIGEEYQDAYRAFNERVCRGEKGSMTFEVVGLRGTRRQLETYAAPLRGLDGSVVQLAITLDVSDRKKAEHDLKLQARVLESMAEGVSLTDDKGVIVYTNPAEDRMFGYGRGELIGQHLSVQNGFPAEENQRIVGEIVERLKAEGAWSGEFSNRGKDGNEFTTFARITALETGGRRYFVRVQEDITERKRVERELQDARSRLDAGLEAGAIVTWTWDIPSNRLFADKNLARLFNLIPSEAEGGLLDRYIQSIHPEDWPRVSEALTHSVESGGNYEADYRIIQADGSVRWVVARGQIERDERGRAVRMPGVLVDITERKRLEEELRVRLEQLAEVNRRKEELLVSLRESEEKLRLLADTIPQLAWMARPDGYVFWYNRRWYEYTGTTPEEMEGWGWQSVNAPDELPKVLESWKASIATGEPFDMVLPLRGADGQFRPFLTRVNPLRDEAGGILYWFGTNTDISEQKQAEGELRYRNDLMRAITDTATTAIFMMDERSRCTFMNPAAEQMTRYSFQEVEGQILHDLIHHTRPDGSPYPMYECPIDRALPEGFVVNSHEDLFVRKDGLLFPVLCNARPVIREGKPVGTVIEVRDITLQKQAEAALRESEAYFRDLMHNMPLVVWTNLPDGRVDFVNRRWLDMTGQTLEYVRTGAEAWMIALHPDDRDRAAAIYLRGVRSGEGFTMEARFRRASDGEYRWHLNRCVPLRDVAGNVVKFLGTCTDIEDQKRLEAELRDADRRKDEFLATLAHELRNPLAPIRNSLQILKMPRVDADSARETREVMERQVHHLIRLVEDLLDMSRVMRGKIELRKEPVELSAVVDRAVETAKPLIEVQGHAFEISLPPEGLLLDADPVRLAQVVGNLLTNAAKYTEPNGYIGLTARREGSEAVLRVRDDGIGVDPEMLPHVFELFVQVDHSSTKAQGGLGIGLTLVKNLVEMHGGTVTAHSAGLGKGCEFVVRLPLSVQDRRRATDEEGGESRQDARPSGHRLLVVDDNKDAALSLAMLLRLQGHEVRVAHDGPSALQLSLTYRPDLVFLDLGMPKMDGYEVARRMRQQPGLENVVLAALTGWGQEEDRRRTADAGFNHHLVKPPEPTALADVLALLSDRR